MPSLIPTFDELLNNIMTSYRNLGGTPSAEQTIRAACQASALWGAYKALERKSKNIFVDSCDEESLWHHGVVLNLTPLANEKAEEYRVRLLDYIQNPPAGGNSLDYERWAEEIYGVAKAYAFAYAQGLGTVDVVVVADETQTGSEIPTQLARHGACTGVLANKLVDAGAAFDADHPVVAGDKVENPAKRLYTTVTAVDGAGQLALADDIFKYEGESYIVYAQCGESSGVTANKLVDATGAFTDADYPASKGDLVENLATGATTYIAAVDGAGQLSLDDDIFTAIGQRYVVRGIIDQVKKYIDEERPVTASRIYVLPTEILTQAVTMGVSGVDADRVQIATDLEEYMNGFIPKQKLYLAQLNGTAVANGAEDVLISVPAASVEPAGYQMIRPGVITIT